MPRAISIEHEYEKGLLKYVEKSSPPPFLLKTYMLVEEHSTDNIISWNADGTAFVVRRPAEFARDLLPTLFKHCNFSSFIRQLNTYGFRKVTTSRWEFYNDKFQKGKRELLCKIHRRKAWTSKLHPFATIQAASSRSDYRSLLDENKRLKIENGILSLELMSIKRKCKELLDLVGSYTNLDSTNEDDERPKLFGVRLVEVPMERNEKRVQISESVRVLSSQSCK